MSEKKEKQLSNLQKILEKESLITKAEQLSLVENFFQRFLNDLQYSTTSSERKEILSELNKYKEMVKLDYERKSFFSKIFRSTKNPKITFLKEKHLIFQSLLGENEEFKTKFETLCGYKIQAKKQQVKEQKKQKRQMAAQQLHQRAELPEKDENGNYNLDRLALVHVTRYKPKKTKSGSFCLESLATATNLDFPRNTLHFTINHHVSSHSAGGWDDAQYVLVVPFNEMIQKNGKPMGLSSVDTFFETGLNENLELPKGTCLIEPSDKKLPENVLFITRKNRTIYKTKNFTQKERKILGCTDDTPEDKVAEKVKKNALLSVLSKQGYIPDNGFALIDGNDAKIIEKIGKEMNIPTTSGAHLHSCVALSGINRFGHSINDLYYFINRIETLLNAEKVVKKTRPGAGQEYVIKTKDKTETYPSVEIENMSSKLADLKDFDMYMQKNEESYWLDKSTPKEKEVYMGWREKTKKRIIGLSEKTKDMDIEKFLEEKLSVSKPLALKKEKEY